jgi:hypothetical protein
VNEIRQLDQELERNLISYAENHSSDYLLQRVLEARKVKEEQKEK